MQISGGKAGKALTLPKLQGHTLQLGLDKAYASVSREKLIFFLLCKICFKQ